MESLIDQYSAGNRGIMFLMRMLENKGHIDVKTDQGREAINDIIRAINKDKENEKRETAYISPSRS